MDVSIPVTWGANWAWGVPLIVLNSVVHARIHQRDRRRRHEGLWATAYVLLAALPDPRAGMLYSLSALTTYGHASALLPDHW